MNDAVITTKIAKVLKQGRIQVISAGLVKAVLGRSGAPATDSDWQALARKLKLDGMVGSTLSRGGTKSRIEVVVRNGADGSLVPGGTFTARGSQAQIAAAVTSGLWKKLGAAIRGTTRPSKDEDPGIVTRRLPPSEAALEEDVFEKLPAAYAQKSEPTAGARKTSPTESREIPGVGKGEVAALSARGGVKVVAAEQTEKAPPGEEEERIDGKGKPDEDDESSGSEGFRLPGGLHLAGKFDVAYERTDRSAKLASGKNAFRSYHRLLFLSRQGSDIPIGFSAEVLGQYFYELNARLSKPGSRLRAMVHAGKILVPFGPDPLFHKSYGGLTGVDQRTLPIVWSAIGAGVRASYTAGGVAAADEVYVVQGFDLSAPDQTLNMQRDLVAYDGARIAFGNRLALSIGPLTLWYSFYWNQMRFDRTLIMQALDLTLWRPALPLLDRLAVGVGVMRAHVSATGRFGQPGALSSESAYYHFAHYLWLRVYLAEGLCLQGRTGLATFDNRTGWSYDARRATAADGSHHSVGLTYAYAAVEVLLAYYWNFEKVDERPDDLFRLMVTYAF